MIESTTTRLGLCIQETPKVYKKMTKSSNAKCLGMIKSVKVDTLEVSQKIDFYINSSKGNGYPLILGQPWLIKMQAKKCWETKELICKKNR